MKITKEKAINYLKIIVLPVILFTVMTFIFNWDIVSGFFTKIEKNDGGLLAWTLSWNDHKILTDPLNILNPETGIFQANIFYPNQNTLTYSEHAIGISLLSLPVYILSNGSPAVSFNFVMLLSYILNGFFAYLLIRYLTKSSKAGIIGGLIFGFCSYRVISFAHLQNIPVFYMPLMLLAFYKYFEVKKLRYLVIIGIALLLQSLSSWYHMIFIFLLFGIFALYFLYKRLFTKKDIIRFAVMLISILIIILPFALPYLAFNKQNQSAYGIGEVKLYSADLGGYLLPAPNTWISSNIVSKLNIVKTHWQENINFLGYIALLLGILGFISIENKKISLSLKLDKRKFIFIIIGLIFLILSFGPFLRFDEDVTRIPLPYLLIYYLLPPIHFIRAVSRFSTVVPLMLGILAGFGVVKISNRIKNKKVLWILLGIIGLGILFEYYPVVRFNGLKDVSNIPEVYAEVKNNPEVKAIIELPVNVGAFETTGYIYWAGYHLKPIVNGYSGYEPPNYEFTKDIITDLDLTSALLKLKAIGVTHMIVDPVYKGSLDNMYLTLITTDSQGYKLYKIENIPEAEDLYINTFDNEFNDGFGDVSFKFDYAAENVKSEGTSVSNISPVDINKEGSFTFSAAQSFGVVKLKFRAYSEKDRIELICGNQERSFTKVNYLEKYYSMDCKSNEFTVKLYSTEFKDRAMVTSVVVED